MPKIRFSESDLSRNRIVEPAWYLMTINSIGEAPSKDGGSTNYPVDATIIRNADNGSEDFKGVTLIWNFNSKAIGFAQGFLACFGVDAKLNTDYELSSAEGKQIEVFVENDTWQGRIVNRVNHKYRPVRSDRGSDNIPF